MSVITIALFQTDIVWLNPQANFMQIEEQLASLNLSHIDLIVLPETFATGFAIDQAGVGEDDNGLILHWMKSTAKANDVVVVGSVIVNHGDKYLNRLYWVTPQGEVSHYDKRHLYRMGGEHDHVEPGDQRVVIELNGVRLLPSVCYDLRFPVWSRNRSDYDVMINIANWPATKRFVWDTLLKARAIENQCYVVAVNRVGQDGKGYAHSGGTAVYDFKGETLNLAKDNQSQVIIQPLDMEALNAFKEQFPAHLDGDAFVLCDLDSH